VNHALPVREPQAPGHVRRHADDVRLGQGAFAGDARPEAVGAQIHREVDVTPGARHEADADDVRVLEFRGGFGFVPKAALELQVAGVAGHQDFDRDGGPVQLPTREHPGEPALSQQTLEVVGTDRAADQVGRGGGAGGRVGH